MLLGQYEHGTQYPKDGRNHGRRGIRVAVVVVVSSAFVQSQLVFPRPTGAGSGLFRDSLVDRTRFGSPVVVVRYRRFSLWVLSFRVVIGQAPEIVHDLWWWWEWRYRGRRWDRVVLPLLLSRKTRLPVGVQELPGQVLGRAAGPNPRGGGTVHVVPGLAWNPKFLFLFGAGEHAAGAQGVEAPHRQVLPVLPAVATVARLRRGIVRVLDAGRRGFAAIAALPLKHERMEDPCEDLDHLVGGIVVHEDARIKGPEIGLVEGGLALARPVRNVQEPRIEARFFDGPVTEGIHLFVGLEMGDFLHLPQERRIVRTGWCFGFGSGVGDRFGARRVVTAATIVVAVVPVVGGWSPVSVPPGIDGRLLEKRRSVPCALDFQERRGSDPPRATRRGTPIEHFCRHELVKAPDARPARTGIQLEAYRVGNPETANIAGYLGLHNIASSRTTTMTFIYAISSLFTLFELPTLARDTL